MRWTKIRPDLLRALIALSALATVVLAGSAGNRWH
jgi:hypothetical protein